MNTARALLMEPGGKSRRLILAIGVSALIFLAEVIGGTVSGSLALLSDAGHVLTDMLALGLSLAGALVAKREARAGATFGYHRVGVLAALINGAALVAIAGAIVHEAYHRYLLPPTIDAWVMASVAAAGLVGNLVMMRVIGHHGEDLNLKSAWLHIIGDTLSSVGVIVAAIVIGVTAWTEVDIIASCLVAAIIVTGGVRVVWEALRVFLEFSPSQAATDEMVAAILGIEGVLDVHDVHVWSITHGSVAFSAHVLVRDRPLTEVDALRRSVERLLGEAFSVEHTTLQMECAHCDQSDLYCSLPGSRAS